MREDFYLEFENKFRGDRYSILKQLSAYDSLVKLIINVNADSQFIDIGCGRGEWLEKWKDHVSRCFGIESNSNMINACLGRQLDIIAGDAISTIKGIRSSSINVITMFHIIEHLSNDYLYQLIDECYRVLHDNGILIIETPSIDNLLVSSKLFYLDDTHINHINPEALQFSLDKSGFDKSKYYYIHPGPLHKADHLKVTRIFNGVAQDVVFIATKSKSFSKYIFESSLDWESHLDSGLSLLQAATEYDLKQEQILTEYKDNNKDNNILISSLKNELSEMKYEMRHLFSLIRSLKKLISPIIKLIRQSRKFLLFIANKVFNFLLLLKFFRKILTSPFIIKIFNIILKYIFNSSLVLNQSYIHSRVNKFSNHNQRHSIYNKNLSLYHRVSLKSLEYINVLKQKNKR